MTRLGFFLSISILAGAFTLACSKEPATSEGSPVKTSSTAETPAAAKTAPAGETPAASATPAATETSTPSKPGTGSITGHVRLTGKAPGNPVIRMGMDPKCSQANTGKKVVQELVVVDENGDLANAFVALKGKFPRTPVPADPVLINQEKCVFVPRVSGARVGQTLEFRTSDGLAHNAHSQTVGGNAFNLSQVTSAAVSRFVLKDEEVMLRVTCDVHSWMFTYVGVVDHPYFAVTGPNGAFQIDNVPPGTYSIEVWHERYGPVTKSVTVAAGKATPMEFEYTGKEEPPHHASIQELSVPGGKSAILLASQLP